MTFEMRKTPQSAKKFAVILAIVFAIMCFATFAGASKCYAEQKVYQQFDNLYCMGGARVTAVVNDDGVSGYIEFRDPCIAKYKYSEDKPLKTIGGTPIKDIVKFQNGGYVESFWFDDGCLIMHPAWLAGYSDRLKFYARAAGPKGWGSGTGYLRFYDSWGNPEKEDSYELKIWSSILKNHEVTEYYACWAPSFDPRPAPRRIEWHSES